MAFFMYSLLSDRWDGASGSYMGKDWSQCAALFELYEVSDPKTIILFMKIYERTVVVERAQDQKEERKREDRKQKASGSGVKDYSRNT